MKTNKYIRQWRAQSGTHGNTIDLSIHKVIKGEFKIYGGKFHHFKEHFLSNTWRKKIAAIKKITTNINWLQKSNKIK